MSAVFGSESERSDHARSVIEAFRNNEDVKLKNESMVSTVGEIGDVEFSVLTLADAIWELLYAEKAWQEVHDELMAALAKFYPEDDITDKLGWEDLIYELDAIREGEHPEYDNFAGQG